MLTAADKEWVEADNLMPTIAYDKLKKKVRAHKGYDRRLVRRVLKPHYATDQIKRFEWDCGEDFGLAYLKTDLECPFLLSAAKLRFWPTSRQ